VRDCFGPSQLVNCPNGAPQSVCDLIDHQVGRFTDHRESVQIRWRHNRGTRDGNDGRSLRSARSERRGAGSSRGRRARRQGTQPRVRRDGAPHTQASKPVDRSFPIRRRAIAAPHLWYRLVCIEVASVSEPLLSRTQLSPPARFRIEWKQHSRYPPSLALTIASQSRMNPWKSSARMRFSASPRKAVSMC